ncbi:retrovirus-related pol polyprotein from transposon TNT 1-94 [Tanacetum coccineum]
MICSTNWIIVEQAFWSQNSMNSSDPSPFCRPTKVKVPKELPKVSMVNTSLKKLKQHLDGFDVVVKERTTATAIIEGSRGFEHTKACFRDEIIPFVKALKDLFNTIDQYLIDELSEVQNVFHQMEQACLKLETERLNKKDFIKKETYDKLFRSFTTLEKHCISLEVAQSQEKDTVIKKLKERIKSLSGNMNEEKVKKDIEEIETINIELHHRVPKLIAENEHLKQTYKQLYDSIKPTRIRSKEQCDALVNQVNQKSVEISDLNVSLQEKDLVITALKDELRKLKGKDLADNNGVKPSTSASGSQPSGKVGVGVVQIVLWYLDFGCSKHMTGDRSQLTNFVNKFLGTVKFRNDHVAKILGYVAFRQHTCFIRNLEGVDLLTGSRGNNLYTLSLGDMMASSPISRHGLVRGLPKLKFKKDHLGSACAMGESKKKPYKPKYEDTNQEKLYPLHMDLCGPMCVASVNGKKYILVIVDDYSRFTWVKCLRSKDEAPNFIIKFLKMIQVRLKVPV